MFSECDWKTAFHQLKVDDITAERLAITTPWGLYRPQFVPEGIACGSQLLMAAAQHIFEDFSEEFQKLFKRCAEKRIQLKLSKSTFAVTELKFLGKH